VSESLLRDNVVDVVLWGHRHEKAPGREHNAVEVRHIWTVTGYGLVSLAERQPKYVLQGFGGWYDVLKYN